MGDRPRKLDSLTESTPEAWRRWRRHYETVQAINDWQPGRAKREILAAMQGDAADSMASVDLQPAVAAFTIAQALDRAATMFITEQDSDLALQELEDARQKPTETCLQYHVRLANLYRNAHAVNNIENIRALITKFQSTLHDERVVNALHGLELPTYAAAKQAAQRAEAAIKRQARATAPSGGAKVYGITATRYDGGAHGETPDDEAVHAIPRGGRVQNSAGPGTGNCFACAQGGHRISECPLLHVFERGQRWRGSKKEGARARGGSRGGRVGRGGRGGRRGGRGRRSATSGRYGNVKKVNAIGDPSNVKEEEEYSDEDELDFGPVSEN